MSFSDVGPSTRRAVKMRIHSSRVHFGTEFREFFCFFSSLIVRFRFRSVWRKIRMCIKWWRRFSTRITLYARATTTRSPRLQLVTPQRPPWPNTWRPNQIRGLAPLANVSLSLSIYIFMCVYGTYNTSNYAYGGCEFERRSGAYDAAIGVARNDRCPVSNRERRTRVVTDVPGCRKTRRRRNRMFSVYFPRRFLDHVHVAGEVRKPRNSPTDSTERRPRARKRTSECRNAREIATVCAHDTRLTCCSRFQNNSVGTNSPRKSTGHKNTHATDLAISNSKRVHTTRSRP